jgi:glutamate racemase
VDKRPIAVFDSGLGSISIVKALSDKLNKENILYLADRKHHPYGIKEPRVLKDIISNTINYLLNYDPKVIIVGSITPTITILDQLRIETDIPIFGIYLPIEEAVNISSNITILGTRTLIRSNRLCELIKPYIIRANFRKVNASHIIKCIEEGMSVDPSIKELQLSDLVILSSTHLSLIKDKFEAIHDAKFIDGINNTVGQVEAYLTNHDMLVDNEGWIKAMVSKDLISFKSIASKFIDNLRFEEIELSF